MCSLTFATMTAAGQVNPHHGTEYNFDSSSCSVAPALAAEEGAAAVASPPAPIARSETRGQTRRAMKASEPTERILGASRSRT